MSRPYRTRASVTASLLISLAAPAFAQQQPQGTQQRIMAPVPTAPTTAAFAVPTFAIDRYTLPNGLEVILHEDHRSPTVTTNIWYHVGGKDEPLGRNGFAHLFEHLMFQGSRHVAEDTFFLNLERIGATGVNGTTGDDRTNYFQTVPSGRLNLALWLESDRMGFLLDHVSQTTLDSQRRVVLNEYRQNYENAPYGQVYHMLREALYPASHPYHRIAIGTPEDLEAATLEDVRRFFRTYYSPNNATLAITGDFRPAEARALIEQFFAPIPRGPDVPRRPTPATPVLAREARLEVEAGVQLPQVTVAWHTPRYFAAGDAALDLVANVLTHGASSRLYRRMVRELQVAADVEAGQSSQQLGSMFSITITGRPGQEPATLLRHVDEELDRLRTTAPDDAEFQRARTDITTSLIFSLERVSNRADRFNLYNQHVGDPAYLAQDVGRYTGLTPRDVSTAVSTYLSRTQRVVISVFPTPGAPVAGRLRSPGARVYTFDPDALIDGNESGFPRGSRARPYSFIDSPQATGQAALLRGGAR